MTEPPTSPSDPPARSDDPAPSDPPGPSAPPDPAAVTALVGAQWDGFVDLLAAAGPDRWATPTRLTGWTALDLARHAHWGTTFETDGLTRAARGGEGAATGTEFTGAPDELVAALRAAVADLVAALTALEDADPALPVPMPYGTIPLALARQIFLMEVALHRSDLADALGPVLGDAAGPTADPALPRPALGACGAVLQVFWPAFGANGTPPPPGTGFRLAGRDVVVESAYDGTAWGPLTGEPTVVLAGDDEELVLVAYGRRPLAASALTVTGDAALAHRIKEHVPGP